MKGIFFGLLLVCGCRTYDTIFTDDAGGLCVTPHAPCDGLCVDLSTDRGNCGGCGITCGANALCVASVCSPCPTGESACGTSGATFCADLSSNAENCGTCGNPCPHGTTCKSGQCVCPLTTCGADCVDTQSDVSHCGSCTNACGTGGANEIAICTKGQCSVACASPFADCDGNGNNGCESNLQTSAANCGACGRACVSGACSAGLCAATTYTTGGSLGPLAIDATSVYWADRSVSGAIFSAPIAGGTATSLVTDNQATVLGVDASQLVWLHLNDEVDSRPLGGSTTTTLDKPSGVRGMAFAGGYVYYTLSGGAVMRAAEDGSTAPVELTVSVSPYAIAVDGANAYFAASSGDILVVPASAQNATASEFAPAAAVSTSIALDSANVYWADGGGNVFRQPKSGTIATLVAQSLQIATNLASDGVALYWGDTSGVVERMPVTGGLPVAVSKAQPGMMRTVAVDSSRVYWSTDTIVASTTK